MANNKERVLKWMQKNQRDAKTIMQVDADIWDRYNWRSGDMVNKDVHKADTKELIRRKFGKRKISPVVAEILEDANFHTMNATLQDAGLLKFSKRLQLPRYRKAGGKTWDIFD